MVKSVKVEIVGRKAVAVATDLMPEDAEAINSLFGEALSFKPDKEGGTVVIRSTSLQYTSVDIAAELQDRGYLWENPQNLGLVVHPVTIARVARFSHATR